MKTYLLVKKLLETYPETRNSDKELQWRIWEREGAVKNNVMTKQDYLFHAKHFETIRRTRQKIQEKYTHLRASSDVQAIKDEKAKTKGTWIFNDVTGVASFITN